MAQLFATGIYTTIWTLPLKHRIACQRIWNEIKGSQNKTRCYFQAWGIYAPKALLDRLIHHCTPVAIMGDSYRARENKIKRALKA